MSDILPLGKITEKHFDDTFNVNAKGVLFTVQKALPIFNDGGSIILNGSIMSFKARPGSSVYAATKAAIRSFARSWTVELKDRKIRVNLLSPGPIETAMARHALGGEDGKHLEESRKQIVARSPMGRIGQPDEAAKAVVFLASDDSSYITGIKLFVDGGIAQI